MLTRLAIFDLDGTLIDSLGDLADAMNAVLEGSGYATHPRASYRYFVGDGIEMLVRRALPPAVVDKANIPEVVGVMQKEYSERWLATTLPFPQIPELLAGLAFRGIQTAVLSNKPDHPTREIVNALFAEDTFDVIRGARDDVPLKPDPTSTLGIISELGVSPRQTVFVGDTPIDMTTGANAGTRTVGATWGFRKTQELVDAGAGQVIHEPLELLAYVDLLSDENS